MSSSAELTVAITGAGSGLGLGLARYLHNAGMKLALLDIVPEKIAALGREFGEHALVCQGDVRSTSDVAGFHAETVARFGGVDALIGVQGIFDGNRPLREIPLERLDQTFDEVMYTNVRGYITAARIFYDSLAARKGAIVLTASSPASYGADGGGIFYTASKHAILGVVRQLAFEFGPHVRVNGVAPCGIAGSELRGPRALNLEQESQKDIPKEVFKSMHSRATLLEFFPMGDDYGPVYELLISPASRTMTGSILLADQGLMNRPVISAFR